MSGVIEALMISVGFDTTELLKGAKQTEKALDDAGDQAERYSRRLDDATSAAAKSTKTGALEHEKATKRQQASQDNFNESLSATARRLVGLYALFTAGRGVKDFVGYIATADAALGRFARSIGLVPEAVSSLGMAVERSGGSAQAAAAGYQALADAVSAIKTGHANPEFLQAIGMLSSMGGKKIDIFGDRQAAMKALLADINAVGQKDAALASSLGRQANQPQDLINYALARTPEQREADDAWSKKFGPTKQSIAGAQELLSTIKAMQEASDHFGREILTTVEPALSTAAKTILDWVSANKAWLDQKIHEAIDLVGAAISGLVNSETFKSLVAYFKDPKTWTPFADAMRSLADPALWGSMAAGIQEVDRKLASFVNRIERLGEFLNTPLGRFILGRYGLGVTNYSANDAAKDIAAFGPLGQPTSGDPQALANGPYAQVDNSLLGRFRRKWNESPWFGFGKTPRESHPRPGKGHVVHGGWWTPERQQHAYDRLVANGVTPNGAIALISRWKNVESAGGPDSVNPTSGAAGIGQWLGARKQGMGSSFDQQLDHAANEVTSGRSGSPLVQRYFQGGKTDYDFATGASAFERAEGYDRNTGEDNFTSTTAAGMAEVRRNVEKRAASAGPFGDLSGARGLKPGAYTPKHDGSPGSVPVPPIKPLKASWWTGMPGAAAYSNRLTEMASASTVHHHNIDNSRTSSSNVGTIVVHTAATDGAGVGDSLRRDLQRRGLLGQPDYGLA